MFSKLVALCTFMAVTQAGLLPAPAHYSSAAAVSSQSIVRHDEAHAPVAKLAVGAPVAYHAAPSAYHSAPAHYSSAAAVSSQNIVRHDQPAHHIAAAAPFAYHAAPAAAAYHSAPAHYSSAAAVSSQNLVHHDQPAHHAAPAAYHHATPAHIAYHATPAPVAYHAAPAPVAYHHAAPVAKVLAHHEEIAYPKYEYSYSVADGHSGDNKSQQESRDGDVVKGSYSLHEADGSVRTVEYSADDHHGFNAVVHNSAPTHAPVHVKAAPLLVKAAPAIQYYHH